MPGFFNTPNRLSCALQVTNTLLFINAAYDLYTNPRFEALPGMASYALNIATFASNSHRWQFFAASISGTRSVFNFTSSFLNMSLSDLALSSHHLVTSFGLLAADSTLEKQPSPQPKK